jgi:hypothetical protein
MRYDQYQSVAFPRLPVKQSFEFNKRELCFNALSDIKKIHSHFQDTLPFIFPLSKNAVEKTTSDSGPGKE